MKATVNHRETREAIEIALETFEALDVFMEAKWEDNVRQIAKDRLAKAWLPITKNYWRKRLARDNIFQTNGTYYNSPMYFYWANEQLMAAQKLQRRWVTARATLNAREIVLDNGELDLLSEAVTIAQQLLQGIKE